MSDFGINAVNALSTYAKTGVNSPKTAQDLNLQFEDTLNEAIKNAINSNKIAEQKVTEGLSGGGSMADIATSVEKAKLSLQTVTTVKDRAVQAYQDIMKMSV